MFGSSKKFDRRTVIVLRNRYGNSRSKISKSLKKLFKGISADEIKYCLAEFDNRESIAINVTLKEVIALDKNPYLKHYGGVREPRSPITERNIR